MKEINDKEAYSFEYVLNEVKKAMEEPDEVKHADICVAIVNFGRNCLTRLTEIAMDKTQDFYTRRHALKIASGFKGEQLDNFIFMHCLKGKTKSELLRSMGTDQESHAQMALFVTGEEILNTPDFFNRYMARHSTGAKIQAPPIKETLANNPAQDVAAETQDLSDAGKLIELGKNYYSGDGVVQNYSKAKEYFQLAAEQGDATAQYLLGHLYDKGYGVERDKKKAFQWYQLAANQDGQMVNAIASFSVGVFYRDGLGVTQSYSEAAKWIRNAADLGYDEAQFNLGLMYMNGHGVVQDLEKAARWWQAAADQGNTNAISNLELLKNHRGY